MDLPKHNVGDKVGTARLKASQSSPGHRMFVFERGDRPAATCRIPGGAWLIG